MILTNVSLYPLSHNRNTYSMSLMSQQEPISAANGLLAAVWCNSYSCFQLYLHPSPELNIAKQPDFSIRHRTLLLYRFVHAQRHYDSTCNALQPSCFCNTNRQQATASVRGHCAFHAQNGPHFILDSSCTDLRHRIHGCVVHHQ